MLNVEPTVSMFSLKDQRGPIIAVPKHWTTTMQRWETKKELARISERYGRTDRLMDRQTDK